MSAPERLSQLSAPRQALVRMFQSVDFGDVLRLVVHNGEPSFHPEPTLRLEFKLDGTETKRRELNLPDFELREEVRRLLAHLDRIKDGLVDRIEVRAGIPRRIIVERALTDTPL